MFKQLSILALTVSCSYAMESIPTTPIGDINIKQTTEDVKSQVAKNKNNAEDNNVINNIINDFSILNIDKIVQQSNNKQLKSNNKQLNKVNVANDEGKSENNKNKSSNDDITNKDVFFYDSKGEKLVDLKKLITRPFKTMSEDEKDWSRLKMYDWFSEYCQAFMRQVLAKNELNTEMCDKFLGAKPTKYCVMVGLDPHDIFQDVLKFDVNLECYQDQATIGTCVRLSRLGKRLIPLKQWYREQILKAGFVDGF